MVLGTIFISGRKSTQSRLFSDPFITLGWNPQLLMNILTVLYPSPCGAVVGLLAQARTVYLRVCYFNPQTSSSVVVVAILFCREPTSAVGLTI